MSISEKVVIVTGAGTGIGLATARLIARKGASAVLIGRREHLLSEAVKMCLATSSRDKAALGIAINVADRAQVTQAVERTIKQYGRLDAIINNAGTARFAPIGTASPADLELMLDVHLRGPINLIQCALPHLIATRGCIVNVSSVGGVIAMPNRSFYGATKAALNHLTRSLARELAPDVRVNGVLPGPVDTPIYDNLGLEAAESAELRNNLIQATPMKRFARPEEIAPWITNLIDDSSGWVTGALICIDGGRTC